MSFGTQLLTQFWRAKNVISLKNVFASSFTQEKYFMHLICRSMNIFFPKAQSYINGIENVKTLWPDNPFVGQLVKRNDCTGKSIILSTLLS